MFKTSYRDHFKNVSLQIYYIFIVMHQPFVQVSIHSHHLVHTSNTTITGVMIYLNLSYRGAECGIYPSPGGFRGNSRQLQHVQVG